MIQSTCLSRKDSCMGYFVVGVDRVLSVSSACVLHWSRMNSIGLSIADDGQTARRCVLHFLHRETLSLSLSLSLCVCMVWAAPLPALRLVCFERRIPSTSVPVFLCSMSSSVLIAHPWI